MLAKKLSLLGIIGVLVIISCISVQANLSLITNPTYKWDNWDPGYYIKKGSSYLPYSDPISKGYNVYEVQKLEGGVYLRKKLGNIIESFEYLHIGTVHDILMSDKTRYILNGLQYVTENEYSYQDMNPGYFQAVIIDDQATGDKRYDITRGNRISVENGLDTDGELIPGEYIHCYNNHDTEHSICEWYKLDANKNKETTYVIIKSKSSRSQRRILAPTEQTRYLTAGEFKDFEPGYYFPNPDTGKKEPVYNQSYFNEKGILRPGIYYKISYPKSTGTILVEKYQLNSESDDRYIPETKVYSKEKELITTLNYETYGQRFKITDARYHNSNEPGWFSIKNNDIQPLSINNFKKNTDILKDGIYIHREQKPSRGVYYEHHKAFIGGNIRWITNVYAIEDKERKTILAQETSEDLLINYQGKTFAIDKEYGIMFASGHEEIWEWNPNGNEDKGYWHVPFTSKIMNEFPDEMNVQSEYLSYNFNQVPNEATVVFEQGDQLIDGTIVTLTQTWTKKTEHGRSEWVNVPTHLIDATNPIFQTLVLKYLKNQNAKEPPTFTIQQNPDEVGSETSLIIRFSKPLAPSEIQSMTISVIDVAEQDHLKKTICKPYADQITHFGGLDYGIEPNTKCFWTTEFKNRLQPGKRYTVEVNINRYYDAKNNEITSLELKPTGTIQTFTTKKLAESETIDYPEFTIAPTIKPNLPMPEPTYTKTKKLAVLTFPTKIKITAPIGSPSTLVKAEPTPIGMRFQIGNALDLDISRGTIKISPKSIPPSTIAIPASIPELTTDLYAIKLQKLSIQDKAKITNFLGNPDHKQAIIPRGDQKVTITHSEGIFRVEPEGEIPGENLNQRIAACYKGRTTHCKTTSTIKPKVGWYAKWDHGLLFPVIITEHTIAKEHTIEYFVPETSDYALTAIKLFKEIKEKQIEKILANSIFGKSKEELDAVYRLTEEEISTIADQYNAGFKEDVKDRLIVSINEINKPKISTYQIAAIENILSDQIPPTKIPIQRTEYDKIVNARKKIADQEYPNLDCTKFATEGRLTAKNEKEKEEISKCVILYMILESEDPYLYKANKPAGLVTTYEAFYKTKIGMLDQRPGTTVFSDNAKATVAGVPTADNEELEITTNDEGKVTHIRKVITHGKTTSPAPPKVTYEDVQTASPEADLTKNNV